MQLYTSGYGRYGTLTTFINRFNLFQIRGVIRCV